MVVQEVSLRLALCIIPISDKQCRETTEKIEHDYRKIKDYKVVIQWRHSGHHLGLSLLLLAFLSVLQLLSSLTN